MINLKIEKEILKNSLEYQTLIKKLLLKYIDKIASNAIDTLSNTSRDLGYTYLTKVRTAFQYVEDNINYINLLLKKCPDDDLENNSSDICDEEWFKYRTIVAQNTIEIQKTLNILTDYTKFDFSRPTANDILNSEKISSDVSNENSSQIKDLSNEEIPQNSSTIIAEKDLDTLDSEEDNSDTKNVNIILEKNDTTAFEENTSEQQELVNSESSDSSKSSEKQMSNLKENTLIISYTKQVVILPYTISNLKKIYKRNRHIYNSLDEIVEAKYTIPISYYKNTAISRFKEAYSLARKKSKYSVKDSLDLGLELFFKNDLNPAIITACSNIDELDVYLACLEENKLDEFKCFDIIYEALPV